MTDVSNFSKAAAFTNGSATFFAVYDPILAGMVSDLGAKKVTVDDVGLPSHQRNGTLPMSAELLDSLMQQQQTRHEDAVERIIKTHTDKVIGKVHTVLERLASDSGTAEQTSGDRRLPDNVQHTSVENGRSPRRRHFSPTVKNLKAYRQNSNRKGLLEELQKKDMNDLSEIEEIPEEIAKSQTNDTNDFAPEEHMDEHDGLDSQPSGLTSVMPTKRTVISDRLGLAQAQGSANIWEHVSSALGIRPTWLPRQQSERACGTLRQARTVDIDMIELAHQDRLCTRFRKKAQEVTQSRKFEVAASGLIFANAVLIGIQANDAMTRLDNSNVPMVFPILNLVFTIAFTIELLIRISADGCTFLSYYNSSFGWNVFDTVIVLCALADLLFSQMVNQAEGNSEVSSVRMLRMLRLIRIMRLVRVMRFFQDLRKMVGGIISSLKSLMWALLLLTLIMYLVAVCLLQVIAEYLGSSSGHKLPAQHEGDVRHDFGNLVRAIYTLYMAICGGVDWGDVAEPLMNIHWMLGPVFTLYIAFSIFCVLNIVTGVFVESANKLTKADEDTQNMEELDRRKRWLDKVREAFINMDMDGSGEISLPNLESYLKDIRGQLVIHRLGLELDLTNAREFFRLLDNNGNGMLTAEEFIAGCREMRGSAKGFEIARIHHDTLKLRSEVSELHELCEHIQEALGSCASEDKPGRSLDSIPVQGQEAMSLPGSIS